MEHVHISFSNPIHIIALVSLFIGAIVVLKDIYKTGFSQELIFKIIWAPISLYFASMGVGIAITLVLVTSLVLFLATFPLYLMGGISFRDTLPALKLLH